MADRARDAGGSTTLRRIPELFSGVQAYHHPVQFSFAIPRLQLLRGPSPPRMEDLHEQIFISEAWTPGITVRDARGMSASIRCIYVVSTPPPPCSVWASPFLQKLTLEAGQSIRQRTPKYPPINIGAYFHVFRGSIVAPRRGHRAISELFSGTPLATLTHLLSIEERRQSARGPPDSIVQPIADIGQE